MAIPGYLQEYGMSYSESEYYSYVAQIAGLYTKTFSEAVAAIEQIRQSIIENSAPNLLLPNGYVDIYRLKEPTVHDFLSKGCVIVSYGDPLIYGEVLPASGFINGKFHIFFMKAAEDYRAQMAMPAPQQLLPPILYVSDMVGLSKTVYSLGTTMPDAITFCSTFNTKWGETGPSNSVLLYPTTVPGDGFLDGKWSAILEVDGEKIPAFATAVRYYRWFDTTFRRILEVRI